MTKRRKRRAFTLIEVLAALGLIIVLTLTLIVTIRTQLASAARQQLQATVATVNTQIEVAYAQPNADINQFTNEDTLVKFKVITAEQLKLLSGKTRYSRQTVPPSFTVIE